METVLRANGDRPDIIISPLRGKIVAVPTVQETNPSFAFGKSVVYIHFYLGTIYGSLILMVE
jgi:hypothetical protein